jgi:hypothetical protein
MACLRREMIKLKKDILKNSFTKNLLAHKMINIGSYDVISSYQGKRSYHRYNRRDVEYYGSFGYDNWSINQHDFDWSTYNDIEVYDVLVIDAMSVTTLESECFTYYCLNNFLGMKLGFTSSFKWDFTHTKPDDEPISLDKVEEGFHVSKVEKDEFHTTNDFEYYKDFKQITYRQGDDVVRMRIKSAVDVRYNNQHVYPVQVEMKLMHGKLLLPLSRSQTVEFLKQVKYTEWGKKFRKYFYILATSFNKLTKEDKKMLRDIIGTTRYNTISKPIYKNDFCEIQQKTLLARYKINKYNNCLPSNKDIFDSVVNVKGTVPKEYFACFAHKLHEIYFGNEEECPAGYSKVSFKGYGYVIMPMTADFNKYKYFVDTPFGVTEATDSYDKEDFLTKSYKKFSEHVQKHITTMTKLTGKQIYELLANRVINDE